MLTTDNNTQLFKGTLEGCILGILSRGESYGYEIILKLQEYGFEDIKEGTLYPLLLRLEKKGLLTAVFKPNPLGPKRKYYTLTSEGNQELLAFQHQWEQLQHSVNQILKEV